MPKLKHLARSTASALRHRAEKHLRAQHKVSARVRTEADTQRLVHELQVHEVELEMQNTELQRARAESEAMLGKYTELYDFAPVGYFSIDTNGLIHEVNLTGATMLGAPRSQLVHRRLLSFVAPTSRPIVDAFIKTVLAKPGRLACEALLQTATGATLWTDLQASSDTSSPGGKKWCRLAVSDIAALKRGEEAQRSVHALAAANKEANREIARRRAAEESLKESEQTQRALLVVSLGLQTQLRHLTHQIIQAQEEERKQISRELHDEVAQILTGINIQLAALSETVSIRPKDLQQRIARAMQMVSQSIDVVHRFAHKLRPALLDDLGLVPALRSYIKNLPDRKNLHVHLTAFAAIEAVDVSVRTVLYRVAQEALTNVVRHAHATRVNVRIKKILNAVRLEIHDDGKSFRAPRVLEAKRGGRLGLLGMRERVEMVGGHFDIKATPGKGTLVSAEIPMDFVAPRSA